MSNDDINIDYSAAIDEALREAAGNESENESTLITELEPDPVAAVAQEETVQEEVDLSQYFPEITLPEETPVEGEEPVSLETQEGLQEQETAEETVPESLETPEGAQEEAVAEEQEEGEQDPPSIEERLDDLTELLGGLHELLKQLVTGMEEQSKSIDSIGARVIDAVTTVMQHGGVKVAPVKPPVAPAPEEETSEKGPSEAEKQNLETITALKERRS